MGKILLVDDDPNILASLQKVLEKSDYEVITARRAEAALDLIRADRPDVVLMDIRMPGMSGLDAFRVMKETEPRLPVIIMTGYATTASAIEATKLGAYEYLIKPFDPQALLTIIANAMECVRLMRGDIALATAPEEPSGEALIGATSVMQDVYKAIGRVATTDATVLIRGETGTGKELVARAIYQHSRRAHAPLILINCAAIPEMLLESEFFGHERGAFTGADTRRIGKLEQARGGTVFLDEIGEIPPSIQAKILRVLQEKRFDRLGGNDTIDADIRLIAATNRNLERAIQEGKFREDLFHRLNVVTIQVPPLRDRREDIPLMVRYFLGRFSLQLGIERPVLTGDALRFLQESQWPGNVRQLEHCIHRAVIFAQGYPIQIDDLRRALSGPDEERQRSETVHGRSDGGEDELRDVVRRHLMDATSSTAHRDMLDRVDRLLVVEALRLTGGNQTQAAKLLGLTRPTLQARMQRFGIRRETSILDE